jgi:hypothetical protein
VKLLLLVVFAFVAARALREAVFFHRTCRPTRAVLATWLGFVAGALTTGLGIDVVFRGGL